MKIKLTTTSKKIAADLYTPVGIYLRMRDKFRDTILLESTDSHAGENSRSIIAINAIGGIEVLDFEKAEYKFPGQKEEPINLSGSDNLSTILGNYLDSYLPEVATEKICNIAQGLFGYITYDAVQFFEQIKFSKAKKNEDSIPLVRYRLYQYVIIIDHFKL